MHNVTRSAESTEEVLAVSRESCNIRTILLL